MSATLLSIVALSQIRGHTVFIKEGEVRRWQDLSSANRTRVMRQRAHQYLQERPVQDGHQYPYQHQNQDEQPYGDPAYLSNISGATRAIQRVRRARSESSTAYTMLTGQQRASPAVRREHSRIRVRMRSHSLYPEQCQQQKLRWRRQCVSCSRRLIR